METLDAILARFTDPVIGSLHGAAFMAADRSGTPLLFFVLILASVYTTKIQSSIAMISDWIDREADL